jgi:hypothetical protein
VIAVMNLQVLAPRSYVNKSWEMPTDHCHQISYANKSYSHVHVVPLGQCILWCSRRERVKARRLKTWTFRLGETTPTENPGPPGWGLGTRLTALSCKNFVVTNLQLEKPRIDWRRLIEEPRGPLWTVVPSERQSSGKN